jgi:hypothetical protein
MLEGFNANYTRLAALRKCNNRIFEHARFEVSSNVRDYRLYNVAESASNASISA